MALCRLLAVLSFAVARPRTAYAAELSYPSGVKPGDQISGSAGEFFRYKHVLVKPPDDDDRVASLKMSEDVRCQACEIIAGNLLGRSESNSEDHIMDQFDGELSESPEPARDPQEHRVNVNRRGCNKHFKDELLLSGWIVQRCVVGNQDVKIGDSAEPHTSGGRGKKDAEWCLEQRAQRPTERDVDTYSTRNEAAFYACENTLGRYGQEMASSIAQQLEDGGSATDAIQAACREAARCEGRAQTARRKKSGNARRRSSKKTGQEEL